MSENTDIVVTILRKHPELLEIINNRLEKQIAEDILNYLANILDKTSDPQKINLLMYERFLKD